MNFIRPLTPISDDYNGNNNNDRSCHHSHANCVPLTDYWRSRKLDTGHAFHIFTPPQCTRPQTWCSKLSPFVLLIVRFYCFNLFGPIYMRQSTSCLMCQYTYMKLPFFFIQISLRTRSNESDSRTYLHITVARSLFHANTAGNGSPGRIHNNCDIAAI